MRPKLGLVLGMAVVGCGPGTSSPATLAGVEYFGAGSRLVPIVADAGGGAEFLLAWYDRELQAPCVFERGADGALRCLPRPQGGVQFGDPACTQPFAAPGFVQCGEPAAQPEPGPFFWQLGACNTHVYRAAGTAAAGAERPSHFLTGGGCSLNDESRLPPEQLPLELVSPSNFVAAELGPGSAERSPGMKPWLLTAADGAWQIRGFFDVQRGVPCGLPAYDADATDKCLPLPHQRLLPSDPGCRPYGALPASCEEPPRVLYAVDEEPYGCAPPVLTPFEAEGPEQEECADRRQGVSRQLYTPGRVLEHEALPTVERMNVGSGRIRLLFQGHAGVPYFPELTGYPWAGSPLSSSGLGFPSATFLDTRFDELCSAEPAGDNFACISAAWEEADPLIAIGHASCAGVPLATRPKPNRARNSCSAPRPELRGFWSVSGGAPWRSCAAPGRGVTELYEARRFTGDVIYSPVTPVDPENPERCDEEPLDEALDYFVPGDPLDPDLVAQIRVRTWLPEAAP